MIVCVCHVVSDRKLQVTIAQGARSLAEVERACRAGSSCGMCREQIADMLHAAGCQPGGAACSSCPSRGGRVTSPYLATNEAKAA